MFWKEYKLENERKSLVDFFKKETKKIIEKTEFFDNGRYDDSEENEELVKAVRVAHDYVASLVEEISIDDLPTPYELLYIEEKSVEYIRDFSTTLHVITHKKNESDILDILMDAYAYHLKKNLKEMFLISEKERSVDILVDCILAEIILEAFNRIDFNTVNKENKKRFYDIVKKGISYFAISILILRNVYNRINKVNTENINKIIKIIVNFDCTTFIENVILGIKDNRINVKEFIDINETIEHLKEALGKFTIIKDKEKLLLVLKYFDNKIAKKLKAKVDKEIKIDNNFFNSLIKYLIDDDGAIFNIDIMSDKLKNTVKDLTKLFIQNLQSICNIVNEDNIEDFKKALDISIYLYTTTLFICFENNKVTLH